MLRKEKHRIGILTLQASQNYGGVLQASALLHFLRGSGYDARIFDWRRDVDNKTLFNGVNHWGLKRWAKCLLRMLLLLGDEAPLIRLCRTLVWRMFNYRLTSYHFCNWNEVSCLELDAIVVGSDQVWFCDEWHDPRKFLLYGLQCRIPAISYAASFGMLDIPPNSKEVYLKGFKNFSAISVREKSALKLVKQCGIEARHVADPTLLVGKEYWYRKWERTEGDRLVCYIISDSVVDFIPELIKFSGRYNCKVDVFVDALANPVRFDSPLSGLKGWGRLIRLRFCSTVKLHMSAGPKEFVQAFARAKWILSDSFHALMFAAIYDKEIRIIRPTKNHKIKMFGRITDFLSDFVRGTVVVDGFREGLESLSDERTVEYNGFKLQKFIEESKLWLLSRIKEMFSQDRGIHA